MGRLTGLALAAVASLAGLTSCFDDGDDDKKLNEAWRTLNLEYFESKGNETDAQGRKLYELRAPVWDPGAEILFRRHNDPALTAGNMVPLDNSTCDVIYGVRDIEGKLLDSSYGNRQYGDSIYRTRPNGNIPGFRAALGMMHVGDSVSVVIPYTAGYGAVEHGDVRPYSTLCFEIKLVGIKAYEVPR